MKLPKMPPLPPMPKLPPMPGAKPSTAPDVDGATFLDGVVKETSESFDKLKADIKAEQHRFEIVNDSEYWVAFCFESRAQKEEFLRLFDLLQLGDKYIDGLKAARTMGKPLTSPRVRWPKHRENRNWLRFR